jgi:hypothetical protein
MPRPERSLDPSSGPLARFAADLRQLRMDAGTPTYSKLATRTRYSASALSSAASGDKLPTVEVTLAYVEACGGDGAAWRKRWHQVREEAAVRPDARPGIPAPPALPGRRRRLRWLAVILPAATAAVVLSVLLLPGHQPSHRPAASPRRAGTAAGAATSTARTGVPQAAASAVIDFPKPGADVYACEDFRGRSSLPPGDTLIIAVRNLDNGDDGNYLQAVNDYDKPAVSPQWNANQYFGQGDDSVGQDYNVALLIMPIKDVQRLNIPGTAWGQAGFPEGAVEVQQFTVHRVAGLKSSPDCS